MSSDPWTPPNPPNVQRILSTANEDTRKGLYERALAKFLWFHKNVLKHDAGQAGVRLSFALAYWLELAAKYEPAHNAFISIRDETETAFLQDPSNFDLFHDFASMNRYLGDGIRTANLFEMIATGDRANAQRLYPIAEPSLVAAFRFRACDPFLDSRERLIAAAECFRLSKRFEEKRQDDKVPARRFARSHYIQNVATLIALLVINDRADEAHQAYNDALEVVNDEDCRTIMDKAMTGHLPNRDAC